MLAGPHPHSLGPSWSLFADDFCACPWLSVSPSLFVRGNKRSPFIGQDGNSGGWCSRSSSQAARDRRWWIKTLSLLAPRRMILEHLSQKVSGGTEPQVPIGVNYSSIHTCFSNLCPSWSHLHTPHVKWASWGHLSGSSCRCVSVWDSPVRIHSKAIYSLDSEHTHFKTSVDGFVAQSGRVLFHLPVTELLLLVRLCLLQTKSIFSLPEISLPFLWWPSDSHWINLTRVWTYWVDNFMEWFYFSSNCYWVCSSQWI